MTSEVEIITESPLPPVIDNDAVLAAERAAESKRLKAESAALLEDLKKRHAEEARLVAEQDAALQAVRDACNACRNFTVPKMGS